eukprot:767525-Hanusia_phi.AAC.1
MPGSSALPPYRQRRAAAREHEGVGRKVGKPVGGGARRIKGGERYPGPMSDTRASDRIAARVGWSRVGLARLGAAG